MTSNLTRRRMLSLTGFGTLAAAIGGCAYTLSRPVSALPLAAPSPVPVTAQIGRRLRLHMFQTGWVAVKQEHKAFSGPPSLRIPAIMASRSWTDWMPVTAYVIEHPDGLFVVDTGETARMLDPEYAACDPGTGLFYRRNLQFALQAEDELGPQMRRTGLDPRRVSKVVMTHLHSDHMGGMRVFPQAQFLVSQAARSGHTGALMCRIPPSLTLLAVELQEAQAGVFGQSYDVSADGRIRIVPTPGHAMGHQSVLIQDDGISLCLVGDAAFSLDQIRTGEIGGIVQSVPDARSSALLLRRQYDTFGTVMLPTHDPENADRLRGL